MAIQTLAALLRHQASKALGKPGVPAPSSPFRIGMVVTMDPTPFILGGDALKIQMPDLDATDSIVAVSRMSGTGPDSFRLHLPDGKSWLHVIAGTGGAVDECRFFQRIDEAYPANADEWTFWLGAADGYIGYPQFQSRDGQLWARHWNPGEQRLAPLSAREEFSTFRDATERREQRQHTHMLYSRSTGLQSPCPEAEYLLVTAVEAPGTARIEIHAGIDIDPAAFSLS